MKKIFLNFVVLSVLISLFSACSGSDVDERFVKKWTLFKIDGADPKNDKILGINYIFFDLREDGTYDGKWYKPDSMTDFIDLKGTWLSTAYGPNKDNFDLFLFYDKGNKKSKIFTVTKLEENIMVMKISDINHYFKSN